LPVGDARRKKTAWRLHAAVFLNKTDQFELQAASPLAVLLPIRAEVLGALMSQSAIRLSRSRPVLA
jgi:hypothetical protein